MEINKIISDSGSFGIMGPAKKRPESSEPSQSAQNIDARLKESASEKMIRLVLEMTENTKLKDSTQYQNLNKGSIVDKYV